MKHALNIFKNHIPEHKTKVLQNILSLPLHGTIGNLNSQSNKILSFLAHSEPDLLLYFINHHIKEETITNRPLASFIKKELPIEFIKKNQDHFMKVMPDLFFEFSWDNISTEKKSSEVYSLPFHNILFSINVFDYYNEEHIFKKYLEYLKFFFQKINLPIIINYHLKTSAFFNRNFIESANITLSFDGHNEKFSDYILILNKSFFQHYVIADIMSSSNPHLTTDKYVRKVYLKLKTNDMKIVNHLGLKSEASWLDLSIKVI